MRIYEHSCRGGKSDVRIIITVLLYLMIFESGFCEEIIHRTKSTHCTIIFERQSANISSSGLVLKKCEMSLCRKYNLQGGCRENDLFVLPQEKCYWNCCHSEIFDFYECEDYNKQYEVLQQNSNRNVIIVLVLVFIGLSIAVVIFLVKYIRCCKSREDEEEKKSNNHKDLNELLWKEEDNEFNLSRKCQICNQSEAFITHSCGRMFHLKCMVELSESWQCPACAKEIRKIKFNCIVCLKRSIILRVSSFEELEKKINKSYEMHPDLECVEFMTVELDTERKLTETTKG